MGNETGAGLAALPMYDWPELQSANDKFWSVVVDALQDRNIDAPSSLTRSADFMALWTAPDLFLTQTCGLPFVRHLRESTQIVTTPCFDAEGCLGPYYRSFIVVGRDSDLKELSDLRGRTAALNNWDSQSGFSAFRAALSIIADPGKPVFDKAVVSGAHRQSIKLVADGQADVASIDAVAWALARRHEHKAVARLRILGETKPTAGLPLITRQSMPAGTIEAIRAALDDALVALDIGSRDRLLLTGFESLGDKDYDLIADMDEAFSPVHLASVDEQRAG